MASAIKFTQSLSYRQAKSTLIMALVLGSAVIAVQVTHDYAQVSEKLESRVHTLVDSNLSAAAHITQNIDTELAGELVRGLVKSPDIVGARLIDSFGDTIGEISQSESHRSKALKIIRPLFGQSFEFRVNLTSPYMSQRDKVVLGEMVVVIDPAYAGQEFLDRAIASVSAILALTLFLALSLMALVYRQITKPLTQITQALSQIDPTQSGNKPLKVPSSHRFDEIGGLVTSYNRQLHAAATHLHKRETAELELKFYSNSLEERVVARTKDAEAARQFFQSILENSPAAIACLDSHGRIQQINGAFSELFGYDDMEMVGYLPKMLFRTEADFIAITETERPVFKSKLNYEVTLPLVRKDGSELTVALGSRSVNEDDENAGSIWSLWDITERVRMEKVLRQAKEDAEAATLAKSHFLANMSHEIRTPMNAILGMTWLALKTQLDDRQRDYLTRVRTSAESLLGIINDILDFSKIEAGKLEMESVDFELDNVLQNLANIVSLRAEEKNLEIIFDTPANLPNNLRGDPLRLGQVLLNLTDNAIKFTERGEIVIRCELLAEEETEVKIKFSIRDTGIGMTDDQLATLFDAFTQADSSTTRRFGGTGLGLTISKRIVEMMSGEIDVLSDPNSGSCFSFTAWLGRVENTDSDHGIHPAINFKNIKALVVDDNRASRTILAEFLSQRGVDVTLAESAEIAVEVFDQALQKDEHFDLVLMDWQLPGMDGLEASQIMMDHDGNHKQPIVLMITAYDRTELAARAKTLGIPSVLTKPITSSMLFDAIAVAAQGETQALLPSAHIDTDDDFSDLIGLNVLLVEDNEVNQVLAEELLDRVGIQVTVAADGLAGVYAAKQGGFDLILMDIQMPVMDGYTATETLRGEEKFSAMPIVAMTAHAMAGQRETCLEKGLSDYLSKPIDPHQLYSCLRKWAPKRANLVSCEALPHESHKKELQATPSVSAVELSIDSIKLPDYLPGLNVRLGLKYANEQTGIYHKVIQRFLSAYTSGTEPLANAIEIQEWTEAYRWSHTLKGLAGSIGAEKLQAAASALNSALEYPETLIDKDLVSGVDQLLNEVLHSLREVEEVIIQCQKTQSVSLDVSETTDDLIDQLLLALEKGDSESLDLVIQLRAIMPESALDSLNAVSDLIDNFEFDAAFSLLKSMVEQSSDQ